MSRRSPADIKMDAMRVELTAEIAEVLGSITELQAREKVLAEMLARPGPVVERKRVRKVSAPSGGLPV